MYRAVHLSVPNVIAQFKTVYRDSEGMMIDSRTYNVDLNTGTTIDWDVSLQVCMGKGNLFEVLHTCFWYF